MPRLQDMAEGRSDVLHMPVDLLDEDEQFNVRVETPDLIAHIRSIADSILGAGFRRDRPLTIRLRGERAVITDGHCRIRAVRLAMAEGAEIKTLPCLPEPKHTNDADRTLMLITSNSGKPLDAIEKGEVCKRLVSFGWKEAAIAEKIGVSHQQVNNWLTLAGAPPSIQAAVAARQIAPTEAVKAIKRDGPAKATQTVKDALERSGGQRVTAKTLTPLVRSQAALCADFEAALRAILTTETLTQAKGLAEAALRGPAKEGLL